MNPMTLDVLAARLTRLERANRRWRSLAGLALLGVAFVSLTGEALSKPPLLEAEQLVIRDASGRVRFAIKPLDDGAIILTFRDQMERDRLAIGLVGDGSPLVSLYDEHRRRRLALGVVSADSPGLLLYGKDGASRARLSLDENDTPLLEFPPAKP